MKIKIFTIALLMLFSIGSFTSVKAEDIKFANELGEALTSEPDAKEMDKFIALDEEDPTEQKRHV